MIIFHFRVYSVNCKKINNFIQFIMDLGYKSYYNTEGRYISIPEFYDGKSVFITEGEGMKKEKKLLEKF